MIDKTRLTMVVIGCLLLAALSACQNELAAEDGGAGEGDAGRLVIYSGRSESLVKPIIEAFGKESGIDVQVRYGSTSEMAGVLLTEGENSPADLFYAQDPGGLGAVAAAGLFQSVPAELIELVPPRFVDPDQKWIGVSGRVRTVVYNVEEIPDPASMLPEDLFAFTNPEWEGRVGWAPGNGSFQAMVTAMRATWGDDKTRQWLEGMVANKAVVYSGNTPIVEAVGSGEISVGLVNHYYLYRFLAEQGEGFGARNYFLPGGGPGSLIMVSGAGILSSAANVRQAEQFISYLLSPAGQQYFASQTYEYPVIAGIDLAEGLAPLAQLSEQALEISLVEMADLAGTQALLLESGAIE